MEIRIVKIENNGFDVHYDGRTAEHLTFDEMLALTASITMPEPRPCMQWLKTPEQKAAYEKRLEEISSRENNEPLISE